MTLSPPRVSRTVYPRKVPSIAFAIGGLTSFIIFASLLLFSHPLGSSLTGYIYGTETTQHLEFHHSTTDASDPNSSPKTTSNSPPLLTQDGADKEVLPISLDPNDKEPNSEKSTNHVPVDEETTQDSVETGTLVLLNLVAIYVTSD